MSLTSPEMGNVGPGEMWRKGRVSIYRHCDSVFELLCDGEPVMPIGNFHQITAYLYAEFEVL